MKLHDDKRSDGHRQKHACAADGQVCPGNDFMVRLLLIDVDTKTLDFSREKRTLIHKEAHRCQQQIPICTQEGVGSTPISSERIKNALGISGVLCFHRSVMLYPAMGAYFGADRYLFGTDGLYGFRAKDGKFDFSFIKRRIEKLFRFIHEK